MGQVSGSTRVYLDFESVLNGSVSMVWKIDKYGQMIETVDKFMPCHKQEVCV